MRERRPGGGWDGRRHGTRVSGEGGTARQVARYAVSAVRQRTPRAAGAGPCGASRTATPSGRGGGLRRVSPGGTGGLQAPTADGGPCRQSGIGARVASSVRAAQESRSLSGGSSGFVRGSTNAGTARRAPARRTGGRGRTAGRTGARTARPTGGAGHEGRVVADGDARPGDGARRRGRRRPVPSEADAAPTLHIRYGRTVSAGEAGAGAGDDQPNVRCGV